MGRGPTLCRRRGQGARVRVRNQCTVSRGQGRGQKSVVHGEGPHLVAAAVGVQAARGLAVASLQLLVGGARVTPEHGVGTDRLEAVELLVEQVAH
eukprot:548189-Prymnesium_polylepis.2